MELLRLKRMLSKYSYYRDEFNETEYLFKEYSNEFNTSFGRLNEPETDKPNHETEPETSKTKPETFETNETSETDPETNETETEPKITLKSETIVKLYRKLSLITHPDKKGGSVEIFNQVNSEYSKGNTIGLLLLAQEHKLDLLDFSKDYSEADFENNLKVLADSSARIKSSLAWVWQSADSAKRQELQTRFGFKKL